MLSSRRCSISSFPSSVSCYSSVSCWSPLTPSSRLSRHAIASSITESAAHTTKSDPISAPSSSLIRRPNTPRPFRSSAATRAARGGCVYRVRHHDHNPTTAATPWLLRRPTVVRTGRPNHFHSRSTPALLLSQSPFPGHFITAKTTLSTPAVFVAATHSKTNNSPTAEPTTHTYRADSSSNSNMAAPSPNGGGSVPSPSATGIASPAGNGNGGAAAVSRRFAPLDPAKARRLVGQENVRWVRGVVFDVDGTLCEPQNYMFAEMRAALSIPPQIDILDHIYALPPAQQPGAFSLIQAIERRAMAVQTPQPGLVPLMDYLESRMLHKAICTRNFDAPVLHLLGKFLPGHSFDPIVTRDFRPPKPSPAGILQIAKKWGCLEAPVAAAPPPLEAQAAAAGMPLSPSPLTPPDAAGDVEGAAVPAAGAGIVGSAPSLIMVGDSLDDMLAGRRAGAATVLLLNESNVHLARREETDLVIRRLDDLIVVLENGFVGQHGT